MSAKTNGGAAFPQNDSEECMHGPGMTLRDWFAGQALALFAGRAWPDYQGAELMEVWAMSAYALADKMIEERVK